MNTDVFNARSLFVFRLMIVNIIAKGRILREKISSSDIIFQKLWVAKNISYEIIKKTRHRKMIKMLIKCANEITRQCFFRYSKVTNSKEHFAD